MIAGPPAVGGSGAGAGLATDGDEGEGDNGDGATARGADGRSHQMTPPRASKAETSIRTAAFFMR